MAPVPKFRATAMVAAAALDEVLVGLPEAAEAPDAVGEEAALDELEVVAAAVKLVGSR